MTRTERCLSVKFYSIGEEIANAVTHGIGAVLGVFAIILLCVKSTDMRQMVSAWVYGGSLVVLFTMSCLYHALTNERAKRILRVFDHTSIFLLIAGTYTPYTLVTLRGPFGWGLFVFVWLTAIVGIALNVVSVERFKKFSMICYIVSGWCVIVALVPLLQNLAFGGFMYLLGGGVLYTVGILFYRKKSRQWFHALWHGFVLLAACSQFISIYYYVIG